MVTVKIGKKETTLENRAVQTAVLNFVDAKDDIDLLNKRIKEYKETMIAGAREILGDDDTSTVTFGVDDDKVKITFGWDVKVKDEEALKELLGDRFDDLVTVTSVYKPDTKLKSMALEDDGLKECLSVKEKAPAVAVVK